MFTAFVSTIFAISACSESGEQACEVDENATLLPGPTVTTPLSGRADVTNENLAIELSPLAERVHLGTEIEIWRVAGGERLTEVWSATLQSADDPSSLTMATLADGTFTGVAEANGLLEWEDYAIRARYQLAAETCEPQSGNFGGLSCCPEFTEWSADRSFRVDDGSSYVFAQNQILDVSFEIPQASFDAINTEAQPPGCVPYSRNYYTASVVVDGERFDGIGLRVKGGCGSSRNLSGKASFKANLSWDDPNIDGCPNTRRFHGLKRLTLNNMVQDRSFTHEKLAYHFYQSMGVVVPRAEYVKVSVNSEYWGLYLNLESIDRRMLSRHFESNGGMLYEGTYWCDFIPENVPPNLEDDMCISRKFSDDECSSTGPNSDPTTYEPVRQLANALDQIPDGAFYPAVRDFIDWDAYLSLWAADALLSHWDGYSYDIINNYRVYHNLDIDRWQVIPTGVDQTFDRDVDPFAVQSQLATRCLAEPECEATFVARLSEAIDIFEGANLEAMRLDLVSQVSAEVAADPRKEGGAGAFDNRQNLLQAFIANRPAQVRQYIQNR